MAGHSGEQCVHCYFWEQFDRDQEGECGLCRRYPPKEEDADFPVTYESNWCGEFKWAPDEEN